MGLQEMSPQLAAFHADSCKANEIVTKREYVEAFRGLLERDATGGRCREPEGRSDNTAMHDHITPTKASSRYYSLQGFDIPRGQGQP